MPVCVTLFFLSEQETALRFSHLPSLRAAVRVEDEHVPLRPQRNTGAEA
jgi:hypothetical protein